MRYTFAPMVKIEYPHYDFRIKEDVGNHLIFDPVRKRWIVLTPEEWVRQNFLQYMLQIKHYPPSVIGVEKQLHLNGLVKRCDIVVYKDSSPWMLVECKEKSVALSSSVLEQILNYNIALPVPYLVITNGSFTYAWQRNGAEAIPLNQLPGW